MCVVQFWQDCFQQWFSSSSVWVWVRINYSVFVSAFSTVLSSLNMLQQTLLSVLHHWLESVHGIWVRHSALVHQQMEASLHVSVGPSLTLEFTSEASNLAAWRFSEALEALRNDNKLLVDFSSLLLSVSAFITSVNAFYVGFIRHDLCNVWALIFHHLFKSGRREQMISFY